jgi:type 1 fimbria pilin
MNKKSALPLLGALLLGLGISMSAQADPSGSGTITFTGQITNTPCTLDSGNNMNINMSAATSQLAAVGDTASYYPVRISVSACPAQPSLKFNPAQASLMDAAGVDGALLKSGVANVGIQLTDGANDIDLHDATYSLPVLDWDAVSKSGHFDFVTQLYAMGAAAPGAISASLPFTLTYP